MNDYIPKPSKHDPDHLGQFGIFGGQYVPETLMPILKELEEEYNKYRFDKEFWAEVNELLRDYVGRENPLYHAKNISEEIGAKVYLKREDLNHTGAHKVNNVIAQGLLAKKLGKTKIIAETSAGADNDDLDFYTAGTKRMSIDQAGVINVGVDGTGYDVKFFGATSGDYMLWDEDQDQLVLSGTMKIKEQADADSDTAAFGQIWVNTATPCELYFTDDAGTDTNISAGGITMGKAIAAAIVFG